MATHSFGAAVQTAMMQPAFAIQEPADVPYRLLYGMQQQNWQSWMPAPWPSPRIPYTNVAEAMAQALGYIARIAQYTYNNIEELRAALFQYVSATTPPDNVRMGSLMQLRDTVRQPLPISPLEEQQLVLAHKRTRTILNAMAASPLTLNAAYDFTRATCVQYWLPDVADPLSETTTTPPVAMSECELRRVRGARAASAYAGLRLTYTQTESTYLVNRDMSASNSGLADLVLFMRNFYSIRANAIVQLPTQQYIASVYNGLTKTLLQLRGVHGNAAEVLMHAATQSVCAAFGSIVCMCLFNV